MILKEESHNQVGLLLQLYCATHQNSFILYHFYLMPNPTPVLTLELNTIKQLKFSISPAEQLTLVIRKDSKKKKRKKETVGMIDLQHEQNRQVSEL